MTSHFWEGVERRHRPPRGTVPIEDSTETARIPVYNGGSSTLNALVVAVLLFAFSEPTAGWLASALVASYLGATVYYISTGRTQVYIHLMVWLSLGQNLAIHVILGGFVWSGGFLMWGILVSTSAALLLGRRLAVTVTGIYVAAAVVLLILESSLRASREAPDPTLSALLAADVFVVSLLTIVPIVLLLLRQIGIERHRTESLLLDVLPESIAGRLKRDPGVIADGFDECTVLFADLVGFTAHSASVTPEHLVGQLNDIFSRFDSLVAECGAEKIKTMGDGYLAVAGAPIQRPDHVEVICRLALSMQAEMREINHSLGLEFRLRVGIATGRLVAGVVGTTRLSYDLWGETVNLASRMEQLAEPDTIRVTSEVAAAADGYRFVACDVSQVKGVGPTSTFLLIGAGQDKGSG